MERHVVATRAISTRLFAPTVLCPRVCHMVNAGPPTLTRTTWDSAPRASSVSERALVRQTRRSVKIPRDLDHGSERINDEGMQKRSTGRG